MKRFILASGVLAAAARAAVLGGLFAVPAPAAPPAIHALTEVRLVIAPGQVIESGTLVVRDGIIEGAGAAVKTPADARIRSAKGLTIYPGLIDLYLPVAPATSETGRNPPAPAAHGSSESSERSPLLHPELEVTSLPMDADRVTKLRNAGFTTALAVPKSGLLRGRAAALNLGEGPTPANLLALDVALGGAFELDPAGDIYPSSLMGSVALFRQTLLDASWYRRARAAYAKNPAQPRPPVDPLLEALQPVVTGALPILFETSDPLDELRAAALLDELELRGWLVGTGREQERLAAVAAAKLPLILPIDFPAEPVVGDTDDLSVSLADLRRWDAAPSNPHAVAEAGIAFVLTAYRLADPMKMHANLARALERGLTADQALAALTTVPARWLGIADRAGTLEAGKMANFVVVEGDLFVEKPKIREIWIDGRRYEVAESKPPEIEPAGTWEITVTAGGDQIPVTLKLRGEVDALTGTVSVMGSTLPLSSASVSGKTIEAVFNGTSLGMAGDITLRLDVAGESATGTVESPRGPATLRAERTSTAPPEALP